MKLSRIPRALLAARREVIESERLARESEPETRAHPARNANPWEASRDAKWRKAARQRLAEKRAQARLDPKPKPPRRPIEWNPLAVMFGWLLGSWFGRR